MMYLDNSIYEDSNLPIFNIGWLGKGAPFSQGNVDEFFINKLIAIYRRERVNITRSIYPCPFCFQSYDSILDYDGILLEDQKNEILGISEIWLPNKQNTKVFVSPDLIIHYIRDHGYLPPQEYIDAVNNFDLNSSWFGEKMYEDHLQSSG